MWQIINFWNVVNPQSPIYAYKQRKFAIGRHKSILQFAWPGWKDCWIINRKSELSQQTNVHRLVSQETWKLLYIATRPVPLSIHIVWSCLWMDMLLQFYTVPEFHTPTQTAITPQSKALYINNYFTYFT